MMSGCEKVVPGIQPDKWISEVLVTKRNFINPPQRDPSSVNTTMGEGRLWVSDMGDAPSLLQTSHSLTLIVSGSPIWSQYLVLTKVRERGLSATRAARYLGEPQVASRTVHEISGMYTLALFLPYPARWTLPYPFGMFQDSGLLLSWLDNSVA